MQHETIEKKLNLLIVFVALTVSIAGLVEILPLIFQNQVRENLLKALSHIPHWS